MRIRSPSRISLLKKASPCVRMKSPGCQASGFSPGRYSRAARLSTGAKLGIFIGYPLLAHPRRGTLLEERLDALLLVHRADEVVNRTEGGAPAGGILRVGGLLDGDQRLAHRR